MLDHLTTGEVCVLIGSSCCFYVPDNDEDGGMIQQVIANVTSLRDAVLTPVMPFFVFFLVVMCCFIQCIKAIIR